MTRTELESLETETCQTEEAMMRVRNRIWWEQLQIDYQAGKYTIGVDVGDDSDLTERKGLQGG